MTTELAAIERCVSSAVARLGSEAGPLLAILHVVQDELGCIPAAAIPLIADALNLSRAEVHGVVSFYHHFREAPQGRNLFQLCRAEACQSMNGAALADHAKRKLKIDFGDTRTDGSVTLEAVYCLGLCACAPAAMFNGRPMGRIDERQLDELARSCGVPV